MRSITSIARAVVDNDEYISRRDLNRLARAYIEIAPIVHDAPLSDVVSLLSRVRSGVPVEDAWNQPARTKAENEAA